MGLLPHPPAPPPSPPPTCRSLQRLFVFLPGDYEAGQAYYFTAWAITSLGLKGPESQPPYGFTTPSRSLFLAAGCFRCYTVPPLTLHLIWWCCFAIGGQLGGIC